MNKAWILRLNTLLPLCWLLGPVNVNQSFNPTPVVPEPSRNLQWLLAVSCKKRQKKPQLARSTSSCMSPMLSSCDPGDQLHVAARRPESAIVNPDARHARCSLNEGSGLGWGRVAVQLITGVNDPNWISLSLHMVTSWYWYLQQDLSLSAEGQ